MPAHSSSAVANIEVVARVRPLFGSEFAKGEQSVVHADAEAGTIEVKGSSHKKPRLFCFHRVFDTNARQQDVFDSCVSPLINDVVMGYNVCVFAYGQTGSGKTFTMDGPAEEVDKRRPTKSGSEKHLLRSSISEVCNGKPPLPRMSTPSGSPSLGNRRDFFADSPSEASTKSTSGGDSPVSEKADSWESKGIVHRAVRAIFQRLEHRCPGKFKVTCSHLELYNEEMHDLMASLPPPGCLTPCRSTPEDGHGKRSELRLEVDASGRVRCGGLCEHEVLNDVDALKLIQQSALGRTTKATWSNERSSRSHSIVLVNVVVRDGMNDDGFDVERVGQLSLVDLAGSECIKRAGTQGSTAREGASINQSLLTLGRVITGLVTKQPHIPYRDSKLTRLLQDSLGGNSKTLIVAAISPANSSCEETLSTLQYAVQAACIVNAPRRTERTSVNEQIRRLTQENERLLGLLNAPERRKVDGDGKVDNSLLLEAQNEIKALREKLNAPEQHRLSENRRYLMDSLQLQLAQQSPEQVVEQDAIQKCSQDDVRGKLLHEQELATYYLEEIAWLKDSLSELETEKFVCLEEICTAQEDDKKLRSVMLDLFGDQLENDPPLSGFSSAILVTRKLRTQLGGQTRKVDKLRNQLLDADAQHSIDLRKAVDKEREEWKRKCSVMTEDHLELESKIAQQHTESEILVKENAALEQVLNEEENLWKSSYWAVTEHNSELQNMREVQCEEFEEKIATQSTLVESLKDALDKAQKEYDQTCLATSSENSKLDSLICSHRTELEDQTEAHACRLQQALEEEEQCKSVCSSHALSLQQSLNAQKGQFEHECVTAASHHSELMDIIHCQRTELEEQKTAQSLLVLSLQRSLEEEQEQHKCDESAVTELSSELESEIVCQRADFLSQIEAQELQIQALQEACDEEQDECKLSCEAPKVRCSEVQDVLACCHTECETQAEGQESSRSD